MGHAWRIALEAVMVGFSGLVVFVYHIVLFLCFFSSSNVTSFRNTLKMRREWARQMTKRVEVLPVQTLRNFIMSCTILASVSLLLVLWTASKIVDVVNGTAVLGGGVTLDYPIHDSEIVLALKLIALVSCLFFGFMNFLQCMRNAMHTAFLMNLKDYGVNQGEKSALMFATRMSYHWWLGLRAYYIAVPLFAYILGPSWMLGTTIILIPVLALFDFQWERLVPRAMQVQHSDSMDV